MIETVGGEIRIHENEVIQALAELVFELVSNEVYQSGRQGKDIVEQAFALQRIDVEKDGSYLVYGFSADLELVGDPAGVCIYCRSELVDDDVVLIDETGGDACGVPLDSGAEHLHCNGFAYDPGADEESREVCSTCLVHKVDHPNTVSEVMS